MEVLPMDILKLIADNYYTPIITNKTYNNKFYMIIIYPSNKIKLRLPCDSDYIGYVYKYVEEFIKNLNMNKYSQLQLASNFKINISQENIKIEHKKVEIKIQNSELIREQLIEALSFYLSYLADEDSM